MLGKNFVEKCKSTIVLTDPWPHTVTYDHIDKESFENKEEVISFENDITLEKWLNNNLLAKK